MKNRKLYFGIFVLIIFLGLCLIIKSNQLKVAIYQKSIINNNAYIINAIIDKHPELEEELLDEIIANKSNYNGFKFLEKYGLNKEDIIDNYITSHDKDLLRKDILYYLLFVFILILAYLLYLRNENKKIKQIDHYIMDILNNRDTFDIRDYNEDVLSKLKNDIYKITVLLKEEKEKSLSEKKDLEVILSDISHQIKTPLTSMYVINDLLLNDNLDKQKRKIFLNKNKLQLERIEWLVTSLLKISRLDSGTVQLQKRKTKVIDLITKVVEPLKIPIELKNQELVIDIDNTLIINIDLEWTVEAFINILKNAHEHTKSKGVITISAKENPIYTEITITDNGEGIDKDNIKHIFERFYKGSSNKESIGIGLNMAKTIIEKEDGIIEVDSKQNEYTTFKIKFYKTK